MTTTQLTKQKIIRNNKIQKIKNNKITKNNTNNHKDKKTYIITVKDLVQYCKKHHKMYQLYALAYSYRYNKFAWFQTPTQTLIIDAIIRGAATYENRFNQILENSTNYVQQLLNNKIINNKLISFIHDENIPYVIQDKINNSPIKGAIYPPKKLKDITYGYEKIH